jgi:hypothetical protein
MPCTAAPRRCACRYACARTMSTQHNTHSCQVVQHQLILTQMHQACICWSCLSVEGAAANLTNMTLAVITAARTHTHAVAILPPSHAAHKMVSDVQAWRHALSIVAVTERMQTPGSLPAGAVNPQNGPHRQTNLAQHTYTDTTHTGSSTRPKHSLVRAATLNRANRSGSGCSSKLRKERIWAKKRHPHT